MAGLTGADREELCGAVYGHNWEWLPWATDEVYGDFSGRHLGSTYTRICRRCRKEQEFVVWLD